MASGLRNAVGTYENSQQTRRNQTIDERIAKEKAAKAKYNTPEWRKKLAESDRKMKEWVNSPEFAQMEREHYEREERGPYD